MDCVAMVDVIGVEGQPPDADREVGKAEHDRRADPLGDRHLKAQDFLHRAEHAVPSPSTSVLASADDVNRNSARMMNFWRVKLSAGFTELRIRTKPIRDAAVRPLAVM